MKHTSAPLFELRASRNGWLGALFFVSALTLGACSSDDPPAQGGDTGGNASTGGSSGGSGATTGSGGTGSGGIGPGSGGASTGGIAGVGGAMAGSGGMTGSDEEYPIPENLPDETGADLWLRYPVVPIPGRLAEYQAALTHVVGTGASPTLGKAEAELTLGLSGLTGNSVEVSAEVTGAGAVIVGTPESSTIIAGLGLDAQLSSLGSEGYLVERTQVDGQDVIVVTGNTDIAVLYGSFALLRHLKTHSSIEDLVLTASPKIQNRLLNHWDNLNGSVERGYAGSSIWKWNELPGTVSPRYEVYARANASIGINGTVLSNVNAYVESLTTEHLQKVQVIADVFRPYGIRVYLTAPFNAPERIGGQGTSDPLNAGVQQWWADKMDEVYALIPDFGGMLIKANSEGQPGPLEYGRSHAEGANVLADAVGDRGIVMWRAFVYAEDSPADRIREAYDEFKPLDGQFRDNVFVQAKNGPLDFQPREPFHPLFGGLPDTNLALELQVTKEYLGQDRHLAYLGPMYEEVLQADTHANGAGSTVARVIDGTVHGYPHTAIAGVANIGDDANWTGSQFNQANWYVFGRMAWNPDITSQTVADEWIRQTLSNDPVVVEPVLQMMMASHQTLVDYMTPLGLVHIMATDHHYGPAPWVNDLGRAEWNPYYYHKADASGIGFDRTASGSDAVAQYHDPVKQMYESRDSVPDAFLLFFHRVGWDEQMASGRTLWDELVHRYSLGVDGMQTIVDLWTGVDGRVDAARFAAMTESLQIQHWEARWWRDACLSYFASVSGRSIPEGYAPTNHDLGYYQGLTCPPNRDKPLCAQINTGEPSPTILP